MTELRTLLAECAFENLRYSLIKDVIICGVTDRALRERMLREPTLVLTTSIKLGLAAEQTKEHAKQLTTLTDRSISRINYHRWKEPKQDSAGAPSKEPEKAQFKSKRAEIIKRCKFCASSHAPGSCPAYAQKCNRCHHNNYYGKCCTKRVQTVDEENLGPCSDSSSDTHFKRN